ncbi:MAG TPA: APC family permease, partial [Candidatus Sulfotelmatobacter sp.]|nr:APC family permease [Candidatus Sulfotelmatobacter sp.]
VGNTVVELSKVLPSAGSFYTFTSRGLGGGAGFFTGWLFFGAYALLMPGLFGAVASFAHDYVKTTFNADIPWWIYAFIFMAIVVVLSIRSIKTSVRVDLTLLTVEVVVFLLLATIAIAKAGNGNTFSAFSPGSAPTGLSGVGLGVVFGILSFIGFDAAAVLGEESTNPRRVIPLAVGGSVIGVGIFYVYVMYGLTAGYGLNDPGQMKAFLNDATPFVTLAHRDAPWLEQIVDLCAIAGLFSAFLALQNTTVRVLFSMGREGALPAALGKVHPRFHSPYIAIYTLTAFTIVVGLVLGTWLGPGPTGIYGFTGALGTVGVVLVYILCNIALIRYFLKRTDRNIGLHVVAPILGCLGLLYPLWTVGAPGQAYPYNMVPYIVGVYVLAGIVAYFYLRGRSPEKLAAFGSVVADEPISHAEEGGIFDDRSAHHPVT